MSTYIESLSNLQSQSLDALKQVQATQLAALSTIGQIVTDVPALRPEAAFANLPTFAELAELNAAFARSFLEQQSAYASQLAGIFTATQQNVAKVAERVVATAAPSTK
jgi:hypothetical protein